MSVPPLGLATLQPVAPAIVYMLVLVIVLDLAGSCFRPEGNRKARADCSADPFPETRKKKKRSWEKDAGRAELNGRAAAHGSITSLHEPARRRHDDSF
jgi:hypothetical protein